MVLLLLFVVFVVAPLVELYVIIQVAHQIGALNTIAALIIISFIGAWVVKAAGLSVLARTQRQLAAGRMPTNELVDGGILLFAGALMLAPGFISDVIGIFLVFPPTRSLVRRLVLRSYRVQMARGGTSSWGNGRVWSRVIVDTDTIDTDTIDVDARDDAAPRPPRGELDQG